MTDIATAPGANPFAPADHRSEVSASDAPHSPPTLDPRVAGRESEGATARRYRSMFSIRYFEETLLRLFDLGLLNGTTHCCIGQEADAVGVVEHLGPRDHVFSNHRCHGHYLARTGDVRGLLAEIMGRSDGVCGGIGGSQHLRAPGFASNGVLGGTVANAAGIAMASLLDDSGGVSVVFLGDGALGEGIVYETLNLAALWELPLLVVCEDNHWAQSTPEQLNRAGSIPGRFEAFGIPVTSLDTTDVEVIADAAEREVRAVRRAGPRALVIGTYRLCHHSKNDDNRPADEVAERWQHDPLVIHAERVGADSRAAIESEVRDAIDEIVRDLQEASP